MVVNGWTSTLNNYGDDFDPDDAKVNSVDFVSYLLYVKLYNDVIVLTLTVTISRDDGVHGY